MQKFILLHFNRPYSVKYIHDVSTFHKLVIFLFKTVLGNEKPGTGILLFSNHIFFSIRLLRNFHIPIVILAIEDRDKLP